MTIDKRPTISVTNFFGLSSSFLFAPSCSVDLAASAFLFRFCRTDWPSASWYQQKKLIKCYICIGISEFFKKNQFSIRTEPMSKLLIIQKILCTSIKIIVSNREKNTRSCNTTYNNLHSGFESSFFSSFPNVAI